MNQSMGYECIEVWEYGNRLTDSVRLGSFSRNWTTQ